MKILLRFFLFASITLFFFSCKKDITNTPPPNPDPPIVIPKPDTTAADTAKFRLIAVERRTDDSTLVSSVGFGYDVSGRITSIFSPASNPQGILATISYNGNQAIFAQNTLNILPGIYGSDTIRFTLDSDNKALKRTENRYYQNDDMTGSHIIKTYSFDTAVYEYDAAGLLIKQTRVSRDSSIWTNNGVLSMTDVSYYKISNQQISGGNVVAINEVTTNGNQTTEKNVTFEYTKAYPNNAALSNPAIISEMNLFYDWPLNNGYKNMPDKMTGESISKDGIGNILNTSNSNYTFDLTFDKNGFLNTYFDSNFTGGKWYYRYSK